MATNMARPQQWWCINSDPCGICCVVVTYFLVRGVVAPAARTPFRRARSRSIRTLLHALTSQLLFADYVVDNALLYPWLGGTTNYVLLRLSFFSISALAMLSHARTMLTDPGAVPIEYQPNTLVSARRPGGRATRAEARALCRLARARAPPRVASAARQRGGQQDGHVLAM